MNKHKHILQGALAGIGLSAGACAVALSDPGQTMAVYGGALLAFVSALALGESVAALAKGLASGLAQAVRR